MSPFTSVYSIQQQNALSKSLRESGGQNKWSIIGYFKEGNDI